MDIDDSTSRCMVSVVSVTLVERLIVTATRMGRAATTTHREGGSGFEKDQSMPFAQNLQILGEFKRSNAQS
jgi:hypothetical protein